jgi:hypothetical protein
MSELGRYEKMTDLEKREYLRSLYDKPAKLYSQSELDEAVAGAHEGRYQANWCSRHGANFKRDEMCSLCVAEQLAGVCEVIKAAINNAGNFPAAIAEVERLTPASYQAALLRRDAKVRLEAEAATLIECARAIGEKDDFFAGKNVRDCLVRRDAEQRLEALEEVRAAMPAHDNGEWLAARLDETIAALREQILK